MSLSSLARAESFLDIPYVSGAGDKQKLDIYTPDISDLRPVLIYVHGGAWITGDKDSAGALAAIYNTHDVVVVSVNYRLAPDDMYPAQVQDVSSALRWVHDHIAEYGGDPARLYLAGHSAGAHLVALYTTHPQYGGVARREGIEMQAVFPVDSASYDLLAQKKGAEKLLIGRAIKKTFGRDENILVEASPLRQVRDGQQQSGNSLPPFYLFVTNKRGDAVLQTQAFHEAINQGGGLSRIVVVPGLSHRQMRLEMAQPQSQIFQAMLSVITE